MQVDCEFCQDGAPAVAVASTPDHVYVMCHCHKGKYIDGTAAPFRKVTMIQYPAIDYCGAPAVAIALRRDGRPLGPYLCETCMAAYRAGQDAVKYLFAIWWIKDTRLEQRADGSYKIIGIRAEDGNFVEVGNVHAI